MNNAIYWTRSGLQLFFNVKGNAPKNWSFDVAILEGKHDVIHIILGYSTTRYCNLLQYQLTDLTYNGVRVLIGNRQR